MEGLPLDSLQLQDPHTEPKGAFSLHGIFTPHSTGELVLDCTEESHITGDVTFKKCGMLVF